VAPAQILFAFDSWKTSATAVELCEAAMSATDAQWTARSHPISDGGDGFTEVITTAREVNRWIETTVPNALGQACRTRIPLFAYQGEVVALVESAQACGLAGVGGAEHNDPLGANTRGVGEMILAARDGGAQRIIIGCGGTASTDGGWGAVELLRHEDLKQVDLRVAVDVETRFSDAARKFGAQKGAKAEDLIALSQRLSLLAMDYAEAYASPVDRIPGSGAGGGLAGGLAALGAKIIPGFDIMAELTHLDRDLEGLDLLVSGEGRLDATSLEGKALISLFDRAAKDLQLAVIAAHIDQTTAAAFMERYGPRISFVDCSAIRGEAHCLDKALESMAEGLQGLLKSGVLP